MKRKETIEAEILNSLSVHIAVIDCSGNIIATNKAWEDFAIKNPTNSIEAVSVGDNYLTLLKKQINTNSLIKKVYNGIEEVMQAKVNYFSIDFPSTSINGKRWDNLKVTPQGEEGNVVISFTNITKTKLAEEKLKASEKFLKETQLIASLGTYTLDVVTGRWTCSEVLENIFGINTSYEKSIEGWVNLVHPKWQDQMKAYFFDEVLGKKLKFDKEYKIVRQNDQSERWVHGVGTLKLDKHHQPIKMIGTIRDVTAQKLAEDKLKKSEERFRSLFNKMNEGLLIEDTNGNIKIVNPRFCEIVGYTQYELIGENMRKLLVEESSWKLMNDKNKDRESGISDTYNLQIITKSGEKKWLNISASSQLNTEEEYQGSRSIIIDITDKIRAEQDKENNNKILFVLNQLLELSHADIPLKELLQKSLDDSLQLPFKKIQPKGAIFLADEDDNLTLTAQCGLSEEILKKCSFIKKGHCLCGKVAETKEKTYSKCLGNEHEVTYKGIQEHGHYILPIIQQTKLLGVLNVYFFENHEKDENEIRILEAIANTLEIIIGRKNAERLQQIDRERLKEAQRIAKIGNWELNHKKNNMYWSDETHTIFEINLEKFGSTYESFLSTIHPEDVDVFEKALSAHLKNKKPYTIDHRIITPNGTIKHVREKCETEFNEKGEATISKGTAQDITELKKLEQDKIKTIIHAEENERHRLAQDLHDGVGQSIAAANMYFNGLDSLVKDQLDEETYTIFKTGKKLLNDATQETRFVSHNIMPPSLTQYGLEHSVNNLVGNYQKVNNETSIKIKSNIKSNRFLEVIESSAYRCIQEILSNAVKHAKAKNIVVELEIIEQQLIIGVTDDGKGFDPKIINKQKDKGIGLSNIKQRIDTLEGKLLIKSTPGKGTKISVLFKNCTEK